MDFEDIPAERVKVGAIMWKGGDYVTVDDVRINGDAVELWFDPGVAHSLGFASPSVHRVGDLVSVGDWA